MKPRLYRLTSQLDIGLLASLDPASHDLVRDWAFDLDIGHSTYSCSAEQARCNHLIAIDSPLEADAAERAGIAVRRLSGWR